MLIVGLSPLIQKNLPYSPNELCSVRFWHKADLQVPNTMAQASTKERVDKHATHKKPSVKTEG